MQPQAFWLKFVLSCVSRRPILHHYPGLASYPLWRRPRTREYTEAARQLTRHGARSWNRNLHSHIFCHKSKPLSDRKMATLYYARIIAFLSNLPIKMHDILALKITNTHKNTTALQECSGSSALLNSCVRWHTFLSRGNKYIHCISILEFSEQGGCKLHQISEGGG